MAGPGPRAAAARREACVGLLLGILGPLLSVVGPLLSVLGLLLSVPGLVRVGGGELAPGRVTLADAEAADDVRPEMADASWPVGAGVADAVAVVGAEDRTGTACGSRGGMACGSGV